MQRRRGPHVARGRFSLKCSDKIKIHCNSNWTHLTYCSLPRQKRRGRRKKERERKKEAKRGCSLERHLNFPTLSDKKLLLKAEDEPQEKRSEAEKLKGYCANIREITLRSCLYTDRAPINYNTLHTTRTHRSKSRTSAALLATQDRKLLQT